MSLEKTIRVKLINRDSLDYILTANSITLSIENGKIIGNPYIESNIIYDFIKKNPIQFVETVRIRSKEDVMPPLPFAVDNFFNLFKLKQEMFTQEEYQKHSCYIWQDWYNSLKRIEKTGIEKKLRGNFYKSFIDSLYVGSLAIESKKFKKVIMDPIIDGEYKVDLLFYHPLDEFPLKIDLQSNSKAAKNCCEYKKHVRGKDNEAISLIIPENRKRINGKFWYNENDFYNQIEGYDKFRNLKIIKNINNKHQKLKEVVVGKTFNIINNLEQRG
jgi:hypothetical protein